MPPKLDEIVIRFSDFPTHPHLSPQQTAKVRDVLTWLIFRHPRGYRLTASRLMKLYYMAELRSIEERGRRLTAVEFVNWDHGPWSQAIAIVADAVHPHFEVERGSTRDGHVAKFYKAKVLETQVDLEKGETEVLDHVIDEWKRRKTDDLVKASKETDPFRKSRHGEVLDLATYVECCKELLGEASEKEIARNLAAAAEGKGRRIGTPRELKEYTSDL